MGPLAGFDKPRYGFGDRRGEGGRGGRGGAVASPPSPIVHTFANEPSKHTSPKSLFFN